jgi:SAM-dependent methyltransferase
MTDEPQDCCFDDWVGHWSKRVRRKPTAAGVTMTLLEALEEAGVRDRTVLDIGCGIGDVATGTLLRGASGATGIELSPRAVAEARVLAAERGVGDRATFVIGDGAKADLPPSDVVVLNRVYCCYPDIENLLGRSLAAARHVYAFTAPPSTGVLGLIAKVQARLSNVYYRLRDAKFRGFRVFVHDLDRVDAAVRSAGFSRVRWERRRLAWQLAVYARPHVSSGSHGEAQVAGAEMASSL